MIVLPKVVNSIEELLMAVKKDVFESLDDTSKTYTHENDNPKYVMMQKIDEVVYGAYNPTWYETTYELRDSVEATNARDLGDSVEISLYHDANKFTVDKANFQHGSNYSNKDTSILLPEIINDSSRWGVIEGLFPSDGAWKFDRPYVDETLNALKDGRLKKWLLTKLKEKGYDGI